MILIPPTHGRAGASLIYPHEELEARQTTLGTVEDRLAAELDRIYRAEFGVSPHPSWIQPVEHVEDKARQKAIFRQEVYAPERARQILLEDTGQQVVLQVAVSTRSRVPIVSNPYRAMNADTDPFDRPERYRTFKGWDAETGLMVFGRAA